LHYLRKIFFCALLFLFSSIGAQPLQRYTTFSYNVNEGLLQSTITDVAFDNNNFCWISFPNGIQKFDGRNFINVPIQKGLPDDKLCRFFRTSNGDLLISHTQGISMYDISTDKIKLIYEHASRQPAPFLCESEEIVYCYNGDATICGIRTNINKEVIKYAVNLPAYNTSIENYPFTNHQVQNYVTTFIIGKEIFFFNVRTGKLKHQSTKINSLASYFLYQKSETEVLYADINEKGAFKIYNTQNNKTKLVPIKGLEGVTFSRCAVYHWQKKIILAVNSRLYEIDSNFQGIQSELVNFQNQSIVGNMIINSLVQDNFGNLMIRTFTGGLKKIIYKNYPIRFFNTGEAEKNNIISILPDKKNNRVLAGSYNNGILVYDTAQHFRSTIKIKGTEKSIVSPNVILSKKEGDYVFFTCGKTEAWHLSNDLSVNQALPITKNELLEKDKIIYFGNFLAAINKTAFVQTQGVLYKVNLTGNTINGVQFSSRYIMSGLYHNGQIISHADDELLFIDTATLKVKRTISFKNTGGVRCFAASTDNLIYIGSNKGIFVTDVNGSTLYYYSKKSGLPDECIYAMAFDEQNNLWCSTNKGILKIKDGKVILHLKKEDGLQENEFNTNVIAKAEDGELFFGGVNGVSSFYPSAITDEKGGATILFTKVLINNEPADTNKAPWNIKKLVLPYTHNALAFDFVAMGNHNPEQYIYHYRMYGLDKDWIQTSSLQTIRYSLQPGKYIFKIYASKLMDGTESMGKEITIIIKPPFWKSWWFSSGLILLTLVGSGYVVNRRNRRKYEKKFQLLENERQLKEERERISKDLHDSLGAYANAVLYNTELLEKEKQEQRKQELIGDLKFASKDIITSLRETVWALKKEAYTSEDCLVRIRNFIQPLAKYYKHIHFSIDGQAPTNLTLHYTKALNLVRIIQEAVSNSIKHAHATAITIKSSFDKSNWTLEVNDNGEGFDLLNIKEEEKGNGLHNMQHRATESSLSFQIKTAKGKGTYIIIIV
jgi:signal transduction histidine kinase/ligand-binding sensor domain-containing protein